MKTFLTRLFRGGSARPFAKAYIRPAGLVAEIQSVSYNPLMLRGLFIS